MVRISHWFAGVCAVAALAGWTLGWSAASTDFRVDKTNQVSSVRFGRDQFDYTYTIDVINSGPARSAVRATVTSRSANTVILDGTVPLGDVAAGATIRSTDTFSFRQNRNFPFNPSDLQWTFDYDASPTLDAVPERVVTAGDTLSLQLHGSDPEGAALLYSYSPSIANAMLVASSGAFTFAPVDTQAGLITLTFTVSDGRSTASVPARITVLPRNRDPTITSSPVTAATVGVPYQYHVNATDADGDSLTYSLTSAPSGLSIDPISGLITWTPSAAQEGPNGVTVRVTDGRGGAAEQSFIVSGAKPNTPPTIEPIPDHTVTAGVLLQFSVHASDADGDSLSYELGPQLPNATLSATGAFAFTPALVHVGDLVLTFTASDGKAAASTSTVVHVKAPNGSPTITSTPLTSAREGEPYGYDVDATDPDGDTLTYSLTESPARASISASTGLISWTPSTAQVGRRHFAVRVIDGGNGSAEQAFDVVVASAVDRTRPVVHLSAPLAVTAGTEFTVYASAADNVAVTSVTWFVDDAQISVQTSGPYSIKYAAAQAAGAKVTVRAIAKDAAGNAGEESADVLAVSTPDATLPVIDAVLVPPTVAPGETITVRAVAHDDRGIDAVTLSVESVSIGTPTAPPYEVQYTVPSAAAIGSAIVVHVTARDAAGNEASGEASMQVVGTADTAAPTGVTVTSPVTTLPGQTIQIQASALDDVGILKVVFFVDGVPFAEVTSPPYQVTYEVPADAPAGSQLVSTAVAYDFKSQATSSPAAFPEVVAGTQGVVLTEVYDDSVGLPLAGVTVSVLEVNGTAPASPINAVSDSRGRVRFDLSEGRAVLEFTKADFTRAVRTLEVAGNSVNAAFDARLRPRGAGRQVNPIAGTTVTMDGIAARFDPGAVTGVQAVSITALGGQALPSPLPLGWSPIAAFELAPVALKSNATIGVTLTGTFAAGDIVAQWKDTAREWRRIDSSGIGGLRTVQISELGALAVVRADTKPAAPPSPDVGQALAGVTPFAIPMGTATQIKPSPDVLFMQPGARSDVAAFVAGAGVVPSGTPVEVSFDELYERSDDTILRPDSNRQDFFLYTASGGANADFRASPSEIFDPTLLRRGTIKLAAQRRAGTDGSAIIGPAGGTVTTSDASVFFPAGALAATTPVRISTLSTSAATARLPSGFTLLGGVTIDAQGATFGANVDVALSLANAPGSGATLLWVHPTDLGSQQELQLVASGTFSNGVARAGSGPQGLSFPGFRESGDYLLLSLTESIAFVTGQVQFPSGDPGPAVVTSAGFPTSVVAPGAVPFVVAVPAGAQTLSARSVASSARASAAVNASVGQVLIKDLTLASTAFGVISTIPADGATEVSGTGAVVINFSDRVAASSVTTATVRLSGPQGLVQASPAISADHRSVTLQPETPLGGRQSYSVTLSSSLQSESGASLGSDIVVSRFVTRDLTPSPPGDVAQVSATIPLNGTSVIHGGPGSVQAGALVAVVDSQTGQVVTTIARSDGSFDLSVPATARSHIRLVVRDARGTAVDLGELSFRNADGTVVVGALGGTVRSADGAAVAIPQGALEDGTLFRVQSLPAASVDLGWSEYPVLGALNVDFGAQRAKAPLALSIPAPAGFVASADDVIIVARVFEVLGEKHYQIVNRAHLTDDGRLQNGDPSFPGTLLSGTYAFLREVVLCSPRPCIDWVQVSVATSLTVGSRLFFSTQGVATAFGLDTEYSSVAIVRIVRNRSYDVRVRSSLGTLVTTASFDGTSAIQQGVISVPAPDDGQPISLLATRPLQGSQNNPLDAPLEILFNKSIEDTFVLNVSVRRPGTSVFAKVNGVAERFPLPTLSDGIRFRPETLRLLLGAVYRVEVGHVCEFGRSPQTCLPTQTWEFSTTQPEMLGELTAASVPPALFVCPLDRFTPRELAVVDAKWLAVANSETSASDPCRGVVLVDVSNAAAMMATSQVAQAGATWSVSGLPLLNTTGFNGTKVDAPVVVSTHGGPSDFSFAALYQVTPSGQLLKIGARGLSSSASSIQSGVIRPGFPPTIGQPLRIEAVGPTSAFIATIGIGLQAIDLGDSIGSKPRVPQFIGIDDEFARVEYFSYVDGNTVAHNLLIVLGQNGIYAVQPELFDANARSTLQSIAPQRAQTVLAVSNFTYDFNGNSTIDLHERYDFVLAASATGEIWRLDPQYAQGPDLLFKLNGSPLIRSVAVDRYRRLLYVGTNAGLQVFDLSNPSRGNALNVNGVVDTNHDGIDDRLLFTFDQFSGVPFVQDLKMGPDESTLFVASDRLLSIGFKSCPVQYVAAELKVTRPGQPEKTVRTYAGPGCRELNFVPQNFLNPPHLKIFRNDVINLSDPDVDPPPASYRVSVSALPGTGLESLSQGWKNVNPNSPAPVATGSSLQADVGNVPDGVSQFRLHVSEEPSTTLIETSEHDLVIVRPLAGAEVKDVVRLDLARAAVFASRFRLVYGAEIDLCQAALAQGQPAGTVPCALLLPRMQEYFWANFDYFGMAVGTTPHFNADNAMSLSRGTGQGLAGLGGVYTWFGVPIRSSKITNVLWAFVMKRIGISDLLITPAALIYGAAPGANDPSSNLSYALGQQLADDPRGEMAAYEQVITPLQLRRIVELSRDPTTLQDPKEYFLWPNSEPAQNRYVDYKSVTIHDPQTQFYPPQSLTCRMDPLGLAACIYP